MLFSFLLFACTNIIGLCFALDVESRTRVSATISDKDALTYSTEPAPDPDKHHSLEVRSDRGMIPCHQEDEDTSDDGDDEGDDEDENIGGGNEEDLYTEQTWTLGPPMPAEGLRIYTDERNLIWFGSNQHNNIIGAVGICSCMGIGIMSLQGAVVVHVAPRPYNSVREWLANFFTAYVEQLQRHSSSDLEAVISPGRGLNGPYWEPNAERTTAVVETYLRGFGINSIRVLPYQLVDSERYERTLDAEQIGTMWIDGSGQGPEVWFDGRRVL